jgi:hypothetical protein
MKITLEIPAVQVCDATSCAYNVGQNCHALAITIGEGNTRRLRYLLRLRAARA